MSVVYCRNPECRENGVAKRMVLTVVIDEERNETLTVAVVVCGACSEPITDVQEESDA